jgi:serine/threonine protein kinase
MLNERSDVYSFGILIMEIISGRNPVDYSRPPGEVGKSLKKITYLSMSYNINLFNLHIVVCSNLNFFYYLYPNNKLMGVYFSG